MNKSGMKPVEYKVLIKPEKVEEKTSGGIIRPHMVIDKQRFSVVKGKLIDVGSNAFKDPDWGERTPKLGDMVLYERYVSGFFIGNDDEEYLLTNDKEICAILEG